MVLTSDASMASLRQKEAEKAAKAARGRGSRGSRGTGRGGSARVPGRGRGRGRRSTAPEDTAPEDVALEEDIVHMTSSESSDEDAGSESPVREKRHRTTRTRKHHSAPAVKKKRPRFDMRVQFAESSGSGTCTGVMPLPSHRQDSGDEDESEMITEHVSSSTTEELDEGFVAPGSVNFETILLDPLQHMTIEKIEPSMYVIVNYEGELWPGVVLSTHLGTRTCRMKTMSKDGDQFGPFYKWPVTEDIVDYHEKNVRMQINTPEIVPPSNIITEDDCCNTIRKSERAQSQSYLSYYVDSLAFRFPALPALTPAALTPASDNNETL